MGLCVRGAPVTVRDVVHTDVDVVLGRFLALRRLRLRYLRPRMLTRVRMTIILILLISRLSIILLLVLTGLRYRINCRPRT